jgi:hypothetical protein
VPEVAVVEGAFSSDELTRIHDVRYSFPVYVPVGSPVPAGFSLRRPPPPPRELILRFPPQLAGRIDGARYSRRLAEHALATTGTPLAVGRTHYLRAVYADHGQPLTDGIDQILASDRLVELAHDLFHAETVVPFTVYANVYLPAQALNAHTDVPAFRGASKGQVPPWLLVAMHHSRLFERWRVPVATVVGYPGVCEGGEFSYYRPSPSESVAERITISPTANSAVALDADTIFHRVEQVAGETDMLPELTRGAYLLPARAERWHLRRGDPDPADLATFRAEEIRYSISWKAYCFPDEGAHRVWAEHSDDLALADIIPALTGLLAERGALPEHGLDKEELAALLIDQFIPVPPPGS